MYAVVMVGGETIKFLVDTGGRIKKKKKKQIIIDIKSMSVKIKRRILAKYETFIIIWILSERIKNNDRFDDPFMRIYFCIIHNFVSFDSFDWRRNHFPRHFSILQNNSLIAVQSTNCINFEYQYFVSTVNKKPGRINYA